MVEKETQVETRNTTQETHAEGNKENTHNTQETPRRVQTTTPHKTSSKATPQDPTRSINDKEKDQGKKKDKNKRGDTYLEETRNTRKERGKFG